MKAVLQHALLIATWLFTVAIILYLWVAKGLEPPYWSLIILLAIAALPLASRLRIGNWFDFTKKVDQLKQDVDSNKKEIQQLGTQLTSMSTQLQSVMLTKQAQHQIVANFPNPETAKAFARSFASIPESLYPPFSAERAEKEDKNVVHFLWAADRVIASSQVILIPFYAWVVSFFEESESVVHDKRAFQPPRRLLQELKVIYQKQVPKEHYPTVVVEEMIQYLDALEKLFDLRDSVYSGKSKPPPTKEAEDIINKASKSVYLISGLISGRLVASNAAFPPRNALPPKSPS